MKNQKGDSINNALFFEAIKNNQIESRDIVLQKTLSPTENIYGVVLCGGNSSRMGTDKAFLQYHSSEQYKQVARLFTSLNLPAIISCNDEQQKKISNEFVCLPDDTAFKNNGPVSGLLTAFSKYPESSFVLIGCDYPLIDQQHIEMLISLSSYGYDAICFSRKTLQSINEPLLAFYHQRFKEKLFSSFHKGNTSIKRMLDEVNTLKIMVEEDSFLKSFDTPKDFHSYSTQGSIKNNEEKIS